MSKKAKIFTLSSLFLFFNIVCSAQLNEGKIRILFIFDGSNSMNAQWENSSKITVAKKLMIQTMPVLLQIPLM